MQSVSRFAPGPMHARADTVAPVPLMPKQHRRRSRRRGGAGRSCRVPHGASGFLRICQQDVRERCFESRAVGDGVWPLAEKARRGPHQSGNAPARALAPLPSLRKPYVSIPDSTTPDLFILQVRNRSPYDDSRSKDNVQVVAKQCLEFSEVCAIGIFASHASM